MPAADPTTPPNPSQSTLAALRERALLWVAHIGHDDRLAPEWRARFPLRQVFVPTR